MTDTGTGIGGFSSAVKAIFLSRDVDFISPWKEEGINVSGPSESHSPTDTKPTVRTTPHTAAQSPSRPLIAVPSLSASLAMISFPIRLLSKGSARFAFRLTPFTWPCPATSTEASLASTASAAASMKNGE